MIQKNFKIKQKVKWVNWNKIYVIKQNKLNKRKEN